MEKSVLVILSGGQDSTTCAFWAKQRFKNIHAITFHYGQKHSKEIQSAFQIARLIPVKNHELISIGPVLKGTSPLVNLNNKVAQYESANKLPGGVEPTFIPGRNILFLTLAANYAASINVSDLVIGVCQEDFGGYYDCRREFIDSMQVSLSQGIYGNNDSFKIHTPLMNLTKKETVELAVSLPGCMEALKYSHTCYNGIYPPCGKCHACILRKRGFEQVGIADPLESL